MAVIEQATKRSKRKTYYERVYTVTDETSILAADAAVLVAAPDSIDSYEKLSIESTIEILGTDDQTVYEVVVNWTQSAAGNGGVEPKETTAPTEISGGTNSRTKLITASKDYTSYGTDAPDYEGMIGVNGETVDGVEVPDPADVYNETHYISAADWPDLFADLRGIKGKKNDDSFRGLAAGSVLFIGYSYSLQTNNVWKVDLSFEINDNITGKQIGTITGIAKRGFDYLWVAFKKKPDATAGAVVQVPRAVYVHTDAIDDGDFSVIPGIVS